MTPFSERFTLSTSSAWRSMGIFLWITPMPPSLAMAIAIFDSVTVSIAAVIIGALSTTSLARTVLVLTSLGSTSDFAGIRSTSSKVSPS